MIIALTALATSVATLLLILKKKTEALDTEFKDEWGDHNGYSFEKSLDSTEDSESSIE